MVEGKPSSTNSLKASMVLRVCGGVPGVGIFDPGFVGISVAAVMAA